MLQVIAQHILNHLTNLLDEEYKVTMTITENAQPNLHQATVLEGAGWKFWYEHGNQLNITITKKHNSKDTIPYKILISNIGNTINIINTGKQIDMEHPESITQIETHLTNMIKEVPKFVRKINRYSNKTSSSSKTKK